MVDRYLGDLPSPVVRTGNVAPEHEGPEGPPLHVSPGLGPDPGVSAGRAQET